MRLRSDGNLFGKKNKKWLSQYSPKEKCKLSMYRLVFILLLLSARSVSAGGYDGNKLLEILGEDRNGNALKEFRAAFSLDKTLKNPALGIKLTASHDSGSVVTAVTVTAAGYELNDIKYKQFEGVLPFNISLNDDGASLIKKFGNVRKGSEDDIKLKFKKDSITISVYFRNSAKKKITYIKFTQNIGSVGPYRSKDAEVPAVVEDVAPKTESKSDKLKSEPVTEPVKPATAPVKNDVKADAPKTAPAATATNNDAKPVNAKPDNKNVDPLPQPATFGNAPAAPKEKKSDDPFYKAIMKVIESGEEEMFKDIKKDPAQRTNFWNYKYTYSTAISIPGEKYNMLYSFPFQSSQLDFISVIEETDGASNTIKAKYTEIEAKLKEVFLPADGWSFSYIVNAEEPNGLKDLEVNNAKLGSIILDYSINPYGKRVLYLRFLLQYT